MAKHNNHFKYEPVNMSKPNLWMHSIDRKDTDNAGNFFSAFAILVLLVLFVGGVLYAIGKYSDAYPTKKESIVKQSK